MVDIRHLDLNLLRALDALLDERHVSRAAARLHLSQPATSSLLARLREVFNDPLLVRTGRDLAVTPRALLLAPRVRAVLDDIEGLLAEGRRFDPLTARQRFVVATTDYVQALLTPSLPHKLPVVAPGVDLALVAPDSTRIERQLADGEIDLAVLNLTRAPGALHSRTVLTERFVVIARKKHPKVRRTLTLDRFCALEHVLVSPRGGSFVGPTDEVLAARGLSRRVRLSVQGFLPVPEIVALSDLIAVYPERLARRYAAQLIIVDPPLELPSFTMV
ncbi:MAG TPA: LysR family transcriptional regulator, partial [Burkholderiaceae bacterium]|nr:LysR family transcriptional regulator [Burkholderiaceae bacterium]